MSDPFKLLDALSAYRRGTVSYLPDPARKTVQIDSRPSQPEGMVAAPPPRMAQVLPLSRSITARQPPAGKEVVGSAIEAKAEELTAQYQPIVEKQLAVLFPKLESARKDLVNAVTRELVDRQLFT